MMEKEKLLKHINSHIYYPATKKSLIEACNNMMDIDDDDKNWVIENLPDGEYKHPLDVIRALKL